MGIQSQHGAKTTDVAAISPSQPACGSLLVVEPDALLRWSLVTYFSKWFNVFAVATTDAGNDILREESINAIIVSDAAELPAAQRMERLARDYNPTVLIVRVVTSARSAAQDPYATGILEKPFELAELAGLLHVVGLPGAR